MLYIFYLKYALFLSILLLSYSSHPSAKAAFWQVLKTKLRPRAQSTGPRWRRRSFRMSGVL